MNQVLRETMNDMQLFKKQMGTLCDGLHTDIHTYYLKLLNKLDLQ